jgi:hypothetical protein
MSIYFKHDICKNNITVNVFLFILTLTDFSSNNIAGPMLKNKTRYERTTGKSKLNYKRQSTKCGWEFRFQTFQTATAKLLYLFISVRWVKNNGEEPTLPGLPFSQGQLFFISFGQLWCSKYRDPALKRLIMTNSHAPGKFRVIGTLQNNEDFAREFNCPLGSKMNPAHKCSVWWSLYQRK